jgi:hypothetical protein
MLGRSVLERVTTRLGPRLRWSTLSRRGAPLGARRVAKGVTPSQTSYVRAFNETPVAEMQEQRLRPGASKTPWGGRVCAILPNTCASHHWSHVRRGLGFFGCQAHPCRPDGHERSKQLGQPPGHGARTNYKLISAYKGRGRRPPSPQAEPLGPYGCRSHGPQGGSQGTRNFTLGQRR